MSGDTRALLKHFPRFRKDTMSGTLGAPCLSWLTATARPRYWFAGHMHARYPGIFWHNNPDNTATPPRETADPEPAAWLEKYGLEPGGGVAAEDRHGDLYSCFLALSKPGGPGAWWEVSIGDC